ncbi:hypothetical protein L332_03430 [Agrococcus pavilionensis RW1]|uniref:Uncharacterized protein n=1 Tax=Agrococcus pavilionensis RW1 TaxID=1330458 RepID=U1LNG5_9MICO|nr:hypothetical protein L332_03430 [Agrococcus pavilionensis RW1]
MDAACKRANTEYQRDLDRRRAERGESSAQRHRDAVRREAVAGIPVVSVDGDRIVIVASFADAGVIAASVLDRALAVEASRYTASSSETGGDAISRAGKVERLRAIHKAMVTVVRSVS